MSLHAPIDKEGFADYVYLQNIGISAEELQGFHEYLRQTHSPEHYIQLAKSYYANAYELMNKKKTAQAIEEYKKAFDLIPNFYEAIDNCAFCYMDLKKYQEAINWFDHSLTIHAKSFLALYKMGECYYHLKEMGQSKSYFEKALALNPEDKSTQYYLKKF